MDFNDISRMRRTVRKFSQTPVEREKLDLILEAGRWAPTAVNGQPQRILIMDTSEALDKVRQFCTFGFDARYVELAKECASDDKKHNVYYYGAPLVLLICWDRTACWTHPQNGMSSGSTDATIVSTHMMLEAASIGLGTAWISYFDHDKARELLNIPENYEINGMLYIGYPADDFEPNTKLSGKRKPLWKTCFDSAWDKPYSLERGEEDR